MSHLHYSSSSYCFKIFFSKCSTTSVHFYIILIPLVVNYVLCNLATAYVTEENNFIILKTRDSGTFVGLKNSLWDPDRETQLKTSSSNSNSSLLVNEDDERGGSSRVYYSFKGIPYAKPPVGNLRWSDPELPDIVSAPKDATKYKSICSQWDKHIKRAIGSQDCLYLNIFTPRLHFSSGGSRSHHDNVSQYEEDARQSVRLLPTLIYVHSGDYNSGSGNILNVERFMDDQSSVLISFNYRLGAFGFLNSGNSSGDLPGNYGILDQISALKWIKKNIHRFGGDPNRITIFGQIIPLLASSLNSTQNLFQGAILMPSESFSSILQKSETPSLYKKFLDELKCRGNDPVNDCLKLKRGEEIVRVQEKIYHGIYSGLLSPVVDFPQRSELTAVFSDEPLNALESEEFIKKKIPILLGVNPIEGFRSFYKFYVEQSVEEQKEFLFKELSTYFPNLSEEDFDEIWNFYFKEIENDSNALASRILDMFSDISVYNTHWNFLQILQKKSTLVYNYVFEHHVDEFESFLFKKDEGIEFYPWEEEFYLFSSIKPEESKFSITDELIAKTLVKIWTNFAAYRNTKNAIAKQKNWSKWMPLRSTPSDSDSINYYHITADVSSMKNDFRRESVEFWHLFLSKTSIYEANDIKPSTEKEQLKSTDVDVAVKSTSKASYCLKDFNNKLIFLITSCIIVRFNY